MRHSRGKRARDYYSTDKEMTFVANRRCWCTDLTWRNDSNLKPIFLQARARSKALEADEMLKVRPLELHALINSNPGSGLGVTLLLNEQAPSMLPTAEQHPMARVY